MAEVPTYINRSLRYEYPCMAKQAGGNVWNSIPPRKLLGAAQRAGPGAFVAVCHALFNRNERARGSPHFLKSKLKLLGAAQRAGPGAFVP
ncbi:Uncharacterized protein OBRU01_14509, partial [Operophtera brumata]